MTSHTEKRLTYLESLAALDSLYDDDSLAVTVWLHSPLSYVLILMQANRWCHMQINNDRVTRAFLDKFFKGVHWRALDDMSSEWQTDNRWVVLTQSELLHWLVDRLDNRGHFIPYD